MSALTSDQRETLAHFTEAPDGRSVLDGDGFVWTYSATDGLWYARRHSQSPVEPMTLARALAPDLAEALDMTGVSE